MPLLAVGKCLGVETRERRHEGNSWIEKTIVLVEGTRTIAATAARDFEGQLPAEGEVVVLEVGVRSWSGRSGANHGFTAYRRDADLESIIANPPLKV